MRIDGDFVICIDGIARVEWVCGRVFDISGSILVESVGGGSIVARVTFYGGGIFADIGEGVFGSIESRVGEVSGHGRWRAVVGGTVSRVDVFAGDLSWADFEFV